MSTCPEHPGKHSPVPAPHCWPEPTADYRPGWAAGGEGGTGEQSQGVMLSNFRTVTGTCCYCRCHGNVTCAAGAWALGLHVSKVRRCMRDISLHRAPGAFAKSSFSPAAMEAQLCRAHQRWGGDVIWGFKYAHCLHKGPHCRGWQHGLCEEQGCR